MCIRDRFKGNDVVDGVVDEVVGYNVIAAGPRVLVGDVVLQFANSAWVQVRDTVSK